MRISHAPMPKALCFSHGLPKHSSSQILKRKPLVAYSVMIAEMGGE